MYSIYNKCVQLDIFNNEIKVDTTIPLESQEINFDKTNPKTKRGDLVLENIQ
jgi:hypothetical protein